MKESLRLVEAILDKPIKGIQKFDSEGIKNVDKIGLLIKSNFKYKEKRNSLIKGNTELPLGSINTISMKSIGEMVKQDN